MSEEDFVFEAEGPTQAPEAPPEPRKVVPMTTGRNGDLHSGASYLPDIHRLLPQSSDAEQGVLCSCLLDNSIIDRCIEKGVDSTWFHIPAHALIYSRLCDLRGARSARVDFILLSQSLKDSGHLDEVGGVAFITQLFVFLPTAANADYYLDILEEQRIGREMIRVGTEFAARSYDAGERRALLAEFESKVLQIGAAALPRAQTMKEVAVSIVAKIQHLYDSRGAITGLPTGFDALDKMTDGLHPAELTIIAARPSMGKTAFAMNMAEHLSLNLDIPIGVFSLEMSTEQLVLRGVASRARVNLDRVRNGFLAERDFPAMQEAVTKFAASKLHIDDQAGISIQQLRAKARRMKSEHDIRAVFVDYLQLLNSETRGKNGNRQEEVAAISGGLKAMSKELGVPVVVLAQLNRNPEARSGGRPKLADLRESGAIEQDADVVGLLWREEVYAESEEAKEELSGKATLHIAKQRSGPIGDIPLTFLKEFARFENRARASEAEDSEPRTTIGDSARIDKKRRQR